MIQIDEQKLRQLFKNRSNCYADAEDVVQAMDEDCFIETINVCRICGTNEEMSKGYDLCYVCWKEYHPDAN
jgi:hypothetical protein